MNIKLVEITNHEEGWKGNWYKTGQRHFVTINPLYPAVYTSKYRSVDVYGGINENDCVELNGLYVFSQCVFKWMKLVITRNLHSK